MPQDKNIKHINDLTKLINGIGISKNAIIYCRSSTPHQNQYTHTSIEMQTFVCREYCYKNELQVVSLVTEVCSARQISNQKKLLKIINNNNDINLIVYDASRFSRNILEGIQILNECRNKNIILHCVKDSFSTYKYQGYLNFVDGIKNGEAESKLLSDRLKSSIQHKRALGSEFGNPAYGYKKEKNNGITKFVDNENEKKIINLATKLYYGCSVKEANNCILDITGENIKSLFTEPCAKIKFGNFTYGMIAEFFNEHNIKYRNEKEWTATQVSNIVKTNKRKLSINDVQLLFKKTKVTKNIV